MVQSVPHHLLGGRDALLLVELGALLVLVVQAEALLRGLLLQHQSGAQPQVVRLAQVLEHTGPDGDGGHALGHGLHEAVQGTGLTVPLGLVAAAAQEGTHLSRQGLCMWGGGGEGGRGGEGKRGRERWSERKRDFFDF